MFYRYTEMELLDHMGSLPFFKKNFSDLSVYCTCPQEEKTSISPVASPLATFVFLIVGILTRIKWDLTEVPIYMSQIINNIDFLFIYL